VETQTVPAQIALAIRTARAVLETKPSTQKTTKPSLSDGLVVLSTSPYTVLTGVSKKLFRKRKKQ